MIDDYAAIRDYPLDRLASDADAWQRLAAEFTAQATDYQQDVLQKVDDGTWHGSAADTALPVLRQTHDMLAGAQNYLAVVTAALPVAADCYEAAKIQTQGAASAAGEAGCTIDDGGNVSLPAPGMIDWDFPPVVDAMKAQWEAYEARYMAFVADQALMPMLNCADRLQQYAAPDFLANSGADLAAHQQTLRGLAEQVRGISNDFGSVPPDTSAQPWNAAAPTSQDHDNWEFMGFYGRMYFAAQGWSNADRLLTHWLQDSGAWCPVDPVEMMDAMPTFKQAVLSHFSDKGDGLFDSGWLNFSPGNSVESEDWYYALNDFRYRVVALRMTGADGSSVSEYTVGVKKPYVFGHDDVVGGNVVGHRTNISHGGITMTQDELMRLHTTGLAQNFIVMGIAQQGSGLVSVVGRHLF